MSAHFTANTQPRRASRLLGIVPLVALLVASNAGAQVDVFPPLDNVMLLVDTSGSMEFQIDGSDVTCNAGNDAQTNDRTRWVHVVEALTGTVRNYSCETLARTSASFDQGGVYGYTGLAAYDYKYPIPFHRPLSGGCAARPGALPSPNAFVYPSGAISYKSFDTETDCEFLQNADGILDAFGSGVRFGLMTFDSLTNAGTGHSAAGTAPDYATGVAGTWSYIVGSAVQGAPAECTETDQEVGARNAAAPPWEGRMVNFGNPDRGALAHRTKRQQIEEIILATRPFGATPIAGMLKDAEDFFFNDTSTDQDPQPATETTLAFSPKSDPYVVSGCRDQFIILLTDGQPNLDLRPECEDDPTCPDDPDCRCPFDRPEDIALRLAEGASRPSVPVYVVGFALDEFKLRESDATTVTCASIDIDTLCADASYADNRSLQACCSLQRIAEYGKDPEDESDDAGKAVFADTPETLRRSLSTILSAHIPDSSRTQPVLSSAGGSVNGMQRFYSSYVPVEFQPWEGRIERQRYICEDDPDDDALPQPVALDIDPDKGDDFAANLNSKNGPERRFYTYLGGRDTSDPINSRATIRPYVDEGIDSDGLGDYGGRPATGTTNAASLFSDAVPAAAMELPNALCPLPSGDACRDRYLKWLIGVDNGTDDTRCEAAGDNCHLLGDVFHSTPRVVSRPLAVLRDETYSKFASVNGYATRPTVLYTSTNDGFLHAFKTFSNDPAEVEEGDAEKLALAKANNELWAFIPPAILPELQSLYPASHQLLLDGAPVVKDVVAVLDEADTDKITFERTPEIAQKGIGVWRTVMVQGFGAERSGYFAIDITDPVPSDGAPTDFSQGGPKFLWQLTLDTADARLFGKGGSTPLITTLYFDGGSGDSEVPVAVLPGGPGDVGDAGAAGTGCATSDTFSDVAIDSAYTPRTRVRCYSGTYEGAHSLTIVRLDTGEIIKTFRRDEDDVHVDIKNAGVVIEAPLDSPITGQPIAYPSDIGAVADRIFVGDADGRVWKVDVSSTDPDEWEMTLFFDAYPALLNGSAGHDFDDGQPIQTPTILSVDDVGQLTVAVSTGDQDTAGTATGMTNYVWSLTEDVSDDGSEFDTKVNWYQPFVGGERVAGPMSLFTGTLYFSTFSPPAATASVCNSGSSRLWGVHYLQRNDETNPALGGKAVVLTNDAGGFVQYLDFENLVPGDTDATGAEVKPVVFGVTIAQLPTCFNDVPETQDDWLGYSHTAMSQINPGKFELVVHTGQGGQSVPGGTTNVFSMPLPMPPALSSVNSWAAIVE